MAVGLLVLAGCGGGSSDDESSPSTTAVTSDSGSDSGPGATDREATTGSDETIDEIGTYEVTETRRTWVDDTRPTAAHGDQPEKAERTLPVVIYSPDANADADPDTGSGPWPVIVFGHGSSRDGDHYEGTLTSWASAGYVIVAPSYPLSSEGTPGGTKYDEVENQTGDVAFLIDQALAELGPDGADADLAGLIDGENVGIGGQSFGAMTALGAGFNECCADPRIDAVTEFAGLWFPLSSIEQDPSTHDRPLLMIHGGEDNGVKYSEARRAFFEFLDVPGGFITLVGANHDDGYFEGPVDDWGTVVTHATLAFYDAHLKGDPTGMERVEAVVADAGPEVATFEGR